MAGDNKQGPRFRIVIPSNTIKRPLFLCFHTFLPLLPLELGPLDCI
jgi:hypothetical protein